MVNVGWVVFLPHARQSKRCNWGTCKRTSAAVQHEKMKHFRLIAIQIEITSRSETESELSNCDPMAAAQTSARM